MKQPSRLITRRQTHTYFTFSVDITCAHGIEEGEEAGKTIFLTQDQHIDLGIVLLLSGREIGSTRSFSDNFCSVT